MTVCLLQVCNTLSTTGVKVKLTFMEHLLFSCVLERIQSLCRQHKSMLLKQPAQYSSKIVSKSKFVSFLLKSFLLFFAVFFPPPDLPENQRKLICEHWDERIFRGGNCDSSSYPPSRSLVSLNTHLPQDTLSDQAQPVSKSTKSLSKGRTSY